MKKFKILASVLVLGLILLSVLFLDKNSKKEIQKPIISLSTFALYDITKHIGGQSVELVNIIPFGMDPHSFELTPKVMANIAKSSLVIYSGAGLEPQIEKIKFTSRVLDMSKYVQLRELGSEEFEFHKHHDKQCAHNRLDPHYWLDFANMITMTKLITNELIKLLPKNESFYIINQNKYIQILQKLDESYKRKLASCKLNSVVLNHNSIGYLAHNYHFHAESLSGLAPESEPTPNDIKRVLQEISKDGISTIFYEKFVNSKVINSIAKDSNVKIDVLQPLGNITASEAQNNESYESLMYKNLQKLSKAMACN